MLRWQLSNNGIKWNIKEYNTSSHCDNLEMSGKKVSMVVYYGIDDEGYLTLSQSVTWPNLRTIPNNTHASLEKKYTDEMLPHILIDGNKVINEKPYSFEFDGVLTIKSCCLNGIEIIRTLFPTTNKSAVFQKIELINNTERNLEVVINESKNTSIERGCYGIYVLEVFHPQYKLSLKPNESFVFGITYNGRKLMDDFECLDIEQELMKRRDFINRTNENLLLRTPNDIVNQCFNFAKLRSAESIFETKSGLMHCPGGLAFYAAIWANDQAEYSGPFFPYLGDSTCNEAALNAYRLFMPFMGPDYRAIPSSIIAEGIDIWEGAGDRGDAAMYAYGASKFALTMGDEAIARELWPAIKWCLEYCMRNKTADGVIASDSDELEGRFPTGKANLSTSSLTYGAFIFAEKLAIELADTDTANKYRIEADELLLAIERYFGANVSGYDTYRYFDGNDILRSWICLPLTMGIMTRREGTVKALFSPELWTDDGLLTQAGDITYWDRSTLYGFRGALAAGEIERTIQFFTSFSQRRLLGEHVPYAVECMQSGLQLSGESALYCQVIIEGFLGITPEGFDSFMCAPKLPKEWNYISLNKINAFGKNFDLHVLVQDDMAYKITITVLGSTPQVYSCKFGESVKINL